MAYPVGPAMVPARGLAPGPTIPGGCYVDPASRSMIVRGTYDAFATEFMAERRGGQGNVLTKVELTPNLTAGSPLFQSTLRQELAHFDIVVAAKEVLGSALIGNFVSDTDISLGLRHSILKARIAWKEYPAFIRTVDMDIGWGINAVVGPTDWCSVDILVPDLDSLPAVLPTGNLQVLFNTEVIASVSCAPESYPRFEGRYTQQYFVQTSTVASSVRAELKPDSRRVQIFSEATGNVAPQFETFFDPDFIPYGNITFPAGAFNTDITEIVQPATDILLTSSPARPQGTRFTVVQELLR